MLKKIAVELSIDLKPLGAGLGAIIKRNQSEETRYSKLRLVVEYLEKHLNVGWVDAPGIYFKGSLPIGWGLIRSVRTPQSQAPYAVYFGSSTDRTIFGMVGSAHHIIGLRSDAPKSDILLFYTPNEILKALAKEAEPAPSRTLMQLIYEANSGVGKLVQPLEFLAKTYMYEKGEGGKCKIR